MAKKDYLSVEDVAALFGFNATTVYRLAQRGKVPGFKMGGRWRFSRRMLEDWVVDRVSLERLKADAPLPPGRHKGKEGSYGASDTVS